MKKHLITLILVPLTLTSCYQYTNNYQIEPVKEIKVDYSKNMEYKRLVTDFYTAFQNGDAENMVKLYHPDVEFEDPAFGKLQGERAKNMWRMLVERSKGELKINFGNIRIHGDTATAEWEAFYKFSTTGRDVHNIVKANFEFKDGLIYRHHDTFDLWRWSKMALGLPGYLLGYTGFFKNKLNTQANEQLTEFISKREKQK